METLNNIKKFKDTHTTENGLIKTKNLGYRERECVLEFINFIEFLKYSKYLSEITKLYLFTDYLDNQDLSDNQDTLDEQVNVVLLKADNIKLSKDLGVIWQGILEELNEIGIDGIEKEEFKLFKKILTNILLINSYTPIGKRLEVQLDLTKDNVEHLGDYVYSYVEAINLLAYMINVRLLNKNADILIRIEKHDGTDSVKIVPLKKAIDHIVSDVDGNTDYMIHLSK